MSEPFALPQTPAEARAWAIGHIRGHRDLVTMLVKHLDDFFPSERDLVLALERIEVRCSDELARLAARDPQTGEWLRAAIERPAGEGEGEG